jgi:hypothetical protein
MEGLKTFLMKNLLFVFLFLGLFACDNTFELIEERKDIPVVYGLISPVDTAQYLRIEKVFVDETVSPIVIAQDPTQLYYDDIVVKIVRVDTEEEFILTEVDGNEEGFVREEGAFANTPNTLYKIKTDEIDFVESDGYRLELDRGDQLPIVTATTRLLETPVITRPSSSGIMDFTYDRETPFQILGNETCFLYDIKLIFYYRERDDNVAGSQFESKSIVWEVANGIESPDGDVAVRHEELGLNFYTFLAGNLQEGNFTRQFEFVDVVADAGGEEILDYQSVGLANLGITSSQDIPTFTNLSEGRGLFSSRTRTSRIGLPLSNRTLDSLINGTITGPLNF